MTEEYRDPERLDLVSGSKMSLIVECPGQHQLEMKLPKEALSQTKTEEDTAFADRGTRIHTAFQTGNTLELSPDENDTYRKGMAYLDAIRERWIHDKGLDPSKITEGPRELRVYLTAPYNWPKLMGSTQVDRHFVYENDGQRWLLVLDLKSGWDPNLPPSAKSWQLKYEAVALAKEEYGNVQDVRVAYVKAAEKYEREDHCDYNGIDLEYSHQSIAFHSWQSTQEDAPRRAGLHCRWCGCKAYCPEALAFSMLPVAMLPVAQKTRVVDGKKIPEAVLEVAPQDLHRIWEAQSVIKKILEEVTNRLRGMTEDELALIGLTHGKPRETINWVDLKGAFEFLKDEKKWDESALWSALEFGLEKLSKLCVKETGIDENYASDEVKQLLRSYYELKEGRAGIRKLKCLKS